MASTFTTNSGFKTFGVFKESQSTTDYTLNKKAKTTFCKANVCVPNKSVGSQGQLELLRRANNLEYYDCDDSFDKTNLNVNLITKLDLTDVCVIQNKATPPECPTPLGPQTRFDVSGVTIDPYGSLFGNDVCGINNFTRYMVYNPQATPNPPPPPPDTCGWTNPFGDGINNNNENGFFPIVHGKDGDIFVGGLFTQSGDVPANSIACWNSVTGIWSNPFGLDLIGNVYSLAYDDINEILYVGGEFTITGLGGATNIAKWSYNSGTWSPLGNGQQYQCLSIVLDTTNNILYAASLDNSENAYLQEWTTSWTDVDQASYPSARFQTLALDGDKNLYVGGNFVEINGNTMNNISKWSITTNSWSALGSGLTGFQEICSCMFYNSTDDSLYVGGLWNNAGGVDVKGIAKWDLNTSSWSIVGPGLKDAFLIGTTSICATSNDYISVACVFINIVDGNPVFEIQVATFNGTSWAYSCPCDNLLSSILPDTDNSIYVTGQFTTAGNVTATRIAKLNLEPLSLLANPNNVLLSFSKRDVDRKTRRRNRDLQDE
jgi:hypothetical protein